MTGLFATLSNKLKLARTRTHHFQFKSIRKLKVQQLFLLDLPTEIIQEFLLYLLPTHILSLALSCRRCYDIAEPILNQTIILPPTPLAENHPGWSRMINGDRRNVFIRRVIVRPIPGYWEGHDLDIHGIDPSSLLQLPALRELVCFAPLSGWKKYREVVDHYGDRLQFLYITMPRLVFTTPNSVSSQILFVTLTSD